MKLTYTAHRNQYLSILAMAAFVGLVELALIGTLIVIFVPAGPWRWGVLVLLLVATLALLAVVASPLWGAHRLTPTHLELRFGWLLRVAIPRESIVSAELVTDCKAQPPLFTSYAKTTRQASAILAPQGHVRLLLAEPQSVRMDVFGGGLAETIIINLDQPEELLHALDRRPETEDRAERQTDRTQHHHSPLRPADSRLPLPVSGQPAILADGLTRRYGSFTAVEELSLAIAPGEMYGFLGMNGAGKTTAIKMLVGLLEPNAGRVRLAGHDVLADGLAARAALGYVPDRALLYERLSGREMLAFLAQLRGLPLRESQLRAEELLGLLELRAAADRPCGSYSFGMRRKLAFAGALLHRPPVLILDEPLNGLDPLSARRIKDLLLELAAGGTAVLLSTHDLATAEALCQRIGIVHQGRLIIEGSPAELQTAAAHPDLESLFLSLTQEMSDKRLEIGRFSA
ncbi:MAG: ABC transporter ATP-binding protein [Chloroflexaceae bacterium]|jgi:ABC-2 type transport system ATP-binding protein|nr:ABC transporter ATP-binding protein [Chloroflexaceae bacterium]